jgi:hypothetical protein
LERNLSIFGRKSDRISYLSESWKACRKYIEHSGKNLSYEIYSFVWKKFTQKIYNM